MDPADEQADAQPGATSPPASADTESIIVTGSRLASSGFNSPTPVTVVGAERIANLGITNVGDALNQIPAFRPSTTPTTAGLTAGTIGARIVDLRGLGPTRTLLLLDGRRFVASTAQGTVDLNNIPTILLSRTEVVTGGASAAYGSDAVAGVVNMRMDNSFTGFRANAEYGVSGEGDGRNYLLGAAYGTSFANGRGHFVIGGEYEDSQAIGDCYTRSWCAEERQALTNSTPGLNGIPSQVITRDVHTSTQTRGGLITRSYNAAGQPIGSQAMDPLRGIQFAPDGTPTPFIYGDLAGSLFMIGGSGHGENAFITGVYIRVPVERQTAYTHATYDLTDDITLFVEGNYGRVDGRNIGGAARDTGNIRIYRDNPYLPASIVDAMTENGVQSVLLGRENLDLGVSEGRNLTETYRFATGLNGNLGENWGWDAYYQFGQSDFLQTIANNRINRNYTLAVDAVMGPNGTPICRSTLTDPDNGCSPLNIFGQNRFSQDAKNFAYGTSTQTRKITEHVIAANVQGEPFSTWAGPVSLAIGGEYRNTRGFGTADPISLALGFTTGNATPIDGRITVYEGYVETAVPLLRDQPFARSFEINAAARRTHYSTSGSVTTWKAGVVYEPNDWLRLRATRSRDIRAPNLSELFSPETATQATITDIATASQGVIPVRSGGNSDLQPEIGDTFTGGIVFQPQGFLSGLRLAVDYYDIKLEGAIASLAPQVAVTQCNQGNTDFCQYLTRGADGILTLVRVPFLNLNTLKTSGIDIDAQYSLPLDNIASTLGGSLNFNVIATHVRNLTTEQQTGSIDIAGVTGCSVTSFFLCVPSWRYDGTISYTGGPLTITARGNYIPKSIYDPVLIGPEDEGYSPSLPNSINTNRVDGRFYATLAVQYNIIDEGNQRIQLFGAIDNAFNTNPPLMPGRGNSVYFDPIGRYFRAGVRIRH